jgi:hypothetical protein
VIGSLLHSVFIAIGYFNPPLRRWRTRLAISLEKYFRLMDLVYCRCHNPSPEAHGIFRSSYARLVNQALSKKELGRSALMLLKERIKISYRKDK